MSATVRESQPGLSLPLLHLYFVWALTLFDFHFLLSAKVAGPLIYLVQLGYPPLLLIMALQGPSIIATAPRWVWYAPLFLLVAVAGITMPFAANQSLAKESLQYLVIFYALGLATAVYVKSPRQAIPIIVMLVGQFAWFALWSGTLGYVPWHPTLANGDGYGAFMVQGAGLCFWFATAAQSKKVKWALFALSAVCVMGVVASYARAAFLSLVIGVIWIWVRSPRKLLAAGGIAGAAIVVVIGASLIFEPGFFYNEIMSAFEEGTDEGTGGERWKLWKAGFRVWMERPILGTGGGNFGAFAATHFRYGELEDFPNPNMLYAFNLHNAYMQVLSEFGVVGVGAFVWTVWDFVKRNREIRSVEAARRWAAMGAVRWNLTSLALGLEAANLANLLCALAYSSLFMPAFYTIWVANRMLWAVVRDPVERPPAVRGRQRRS